MARCELAPGSPWNATFLGLVMAPSSSRSGFCQYPARGFEVRRRVDAARHRIYDGHVDPHPSLERAELFQLLLEFQRRGRHRHKTLQRLAAIRIQSDMVVARPAPPGSGGAGKIQRA